MDMPVNSAPAAGGKDNADDECQEDRTPRTHSETAPSNAVSLTSPGGAFGVAVAVRSCCESVLHFTSAPMYADSECISKVP